MSILDKKQLPPPKSAEAFESLCLDIWRRELDDPHIQRYGRSGQEQHGVDLIGRRKEAPNRWVGIQCKVRSSHSGLQRDLTKDLLAAEALNPKPAEFVFATTLRRDTKLQDFVRRINEQQAREERMPIEVRFWDEIESFLQEDENLDLLERHYSAFIANVIPEGLVLARMFSFSVGVDTPGTLYELIIGKTLDRGSKEGHGGLSYFKDRAFMVNLQTRAAAIFPVPTRHYGDLHTAIDNRIDEYMLSKWLNNFADIDSVLRVEGENHLVTATTEEWNKVCPPRQRDDDD